MKSFTEVICELPDFYHLVGVSEEMIRETEQTLGVCFSNDYRSYLKCYGIASANGHELTGICKSTRLNVLDVTLAHRKVTPEADAWYVVEEANIDGIVIWQTPKGDIYQTSRGTDAHKIFDSLADYVKGGI